VRLEASTKPHVHNLIHDFLINMAFIMACPNFKKGLKMVSGPLGINDYVMPSFILHITFLNKTTVTMYCRRISKDTCARYLEVTWIQFGFVKVYPWPGRPIVHAGPIGSWWLLGICWLRLVSGRWGHHCQNCTSFFDFWFLLTCTVVGRPKVPP
jgi:hypothetical protein